MIRIKYKMKKNVGNYGVEPVQQNAFDRLDILNSIKVGDYVYCIKTCYTYPEIDFIKGKKYLVVGTCYHGINVYNENKFTHSISLTSDTTGWFKFFLTTSEMREKKLKRIVK